MLSVFATMPAYKPLIFLVFSTLCFTTSGLATFPSTAVNIRFQRYFEGYKYDKIAKDLNVPLGTVKTYIHQARLELKNYLKMYR
ncbi:sigma factor-like helix-turn-helix DNA-binding protein [Pedobacter sp. Leaf216]|uniref:RNA polymerase sigma factor n=1 Tax=Pedobacter sp. Leaf216 TaxID=1735684 RepID=UPI0009EB9712